MTLRLLQKRLAVAAALPLALACASAPRYEAAIQAGRSAHVLLVLPLNVAVPLPEVLGDQSIAVWQELESYLLGYDKRLKTVSYHDARLLWRASIAQARRARGGGDADYVEASRLFVRELRRQTEFDAVIAPTVFIQRANVHGTTASWDGVTRRIKIVRGNRMIRRGTVSAYSTAKAASLHAVVFDADGNKLQEGQGGLDLLEQARADEGLDGYASNNVWYFEARPDFFFDREQLREGIAQALKPFLPVLSTDEK